MQTLTSYVFSVTKNETISYQHEFTSTKNSRSSINGNNNSKNDDEFSIKQQREEIFFVVSEDRK